MHRCYAFKTSQENKSSASQLAASALHKDIFPDDEKKRCELFLFSAYRVVFVFMCFKPTKNEERGPKKQEYPHISVFFLGYPFE